MSTGKFDDNLENQIKQEEKENIGIGLPSNYVSMHSKFASSKKD